MDFRPKLYKIVVGLLLGLIIGFLYYRWHLNYEVDRFTYHFLIGSITTFVICYIGLSLTEKRW